MKSIGTALTLVLAASFFAMANPAVADDCNVGTKAATSASSMNIVETAILTYHVVAGKVMSTDVVKVKSATTVQGQDLAVMVKDGKVMVDNAQVVTADAVAGNGVIHVIDTVLLPKEK